MLFQKIRSYESLMKSDHWKKNYYGHFLTALKASKTEIELHHCHHYFKVFFKKKLHHFLETLKGFNFEKWLRQILITRKLYQNSYCTVLCWWTAASQGRLSYHVYDKRTSPPLIFRLPDKRYVRQMKLFNVMNCGVSWTSDKFHRSLHPPPN